MLIQATPFCNIDCTYCYLPHRSDKSALTLDVLERFCSQLIDCGALARNLRVTWHSGEPLAIRGAQFDAYCSLVDRLLAQHTNVKFSVQTNATLIDSQWVDLLRRFDVSVGVSLDGPREFHDAHRITRRGGGTFDAVMRGIEQLRRGGVRFGVICVLTPESLREPDKMFDFFTENHIDDVCFNIEESIGVNKVDIGEPDRRHDLARLFFKRYFERVSGHAAPHRVRELQGILDSCRAPDLEFTTQVSQPGRILSVSVDGKVSTFSPELSTWDGLDSSGFAFVDINHEPLSALAHSTRFIETNSAISAGVEQCRKACSYFRFCGGGSPAAKLGEMGRFDVTSTNQCRAKVMAPVDAFIDLLTDNAQFLQHQAAAAAKRGT